MKGKKAQLFRFSSLGLALVVLLIAAFYAPVFQPQIFSADFSPFGVNVQAYKDTGNQKFQQEKSFITVSEPLVMSVLVNGKFNIGESRRSLYKYDKIDSRISGIARQGKIEGYQKNTGNFAHLSYLLRFYHPESAGSEADPA
ncbi:MAG: hypothetical protein LWY06_08815 [Firmicutes bacterium]|nr:hypothetical protein [Bacillota bacterium]